MIVKVIDFSQIIPSSFTSLAIFQNDNAIVLVESDGCHTVNTDKERTEIEVSYRYEGKMKSVVMSFSDDDLKELETIEEDITEFIDYFGIKDRMLSNYNLLKETLISNGFYKADDFPVWKRR